uniref:Uncharacterized protein n=1 Tax=Rhizophora mucronata TaxID=61149 RepID=A0A2P2N9C8_RHIMU
MPSTSDELLSIFFFFLNFSWLTTH